MKGSHSPATSVLRWRRPSTQRAWDRYRSALKHLPRRDQRLIVGRLELGYSFGQLAAVDGRAGPDAARMALKRALVRLAAAMGDDDARSG